MTTATNPNYSPKQPRKHRGSDKQSQEFGRQYTNRKRGEELPQAVVTEEDVRLIRALAEEGRRHVDHYRQNLTAKAIAEKFKISERAVQRIIAYETWSHVA